MVRGKFQNNRNLEISETSSSSSEDEKPFGMRNRFTFTNLCNETSSDNDASDVSDDSSSDDSVKNVKDFENKQKIQRSRESQSDSDASSQSQDSEAFEHLNRFNSKQRNLKEKKSLLTKSQDSSDANNTSHTLNRSGRSKTGGTLLETNLNKKLGNKASNKGQATNQKTREEQDSDSSIDNLLLQLKKTTLTKPPFKSETTSNIESSKNLKDSTTADKISEECLNILDKQEGKNDEEIISSQVVSAKTQKNRLKRLKKKKANCEVDKTTTLNISEQPNTSNQKTLVGETVKGTQLSVAARLAQKRRLLVEAENKRLEEEKRREEEEEKRKIEEEETRLKLELEAKERKRQARQEAKMRQRLEGKPVTVAEKKKAKLLEEKRLSLLERLKESNPFILKTNGTEEGKKSVVVTKKKKKNHAGKKNLNTQAESNIDVSKKPLEECQQKELSQEVTHHEEITHQQELPYEKIKTLHDLSDWDKSENDLDEKPVPKEKIAVMENALLSCIEPVNTTSEATPSSTDSPKDLREIPVPTIQNTVTLKPEATVPAPTSKISSNTFLRSPICCILGHVDTGKTKLLDKIRHTDVQANEAGGITQQIGATFFPRDALLEPCKKVGTDFNMQVPGLLIIDTPGHESFNNLRYRGSSLCDIAILVIDINHGLEPQTRESLEMLKVRKCPFLIALNKIDRLYDWVATPWESAQKTLKKQKDCTQQEFSSRLSGILLQLAETGLNCDLWWNIKNVKKTVSVVPTSAMTAEGIPDLLYLLVNLTQSVMTRSLSLKDTFQCTILEVKAIEGLGMTIDVVLVSGVLYVNDRLVICGINGPIVTTVRALLTPQPLKELRVKGEYVHHKEIQAAMGVKISAPGLEDAVAGTSILLARDLDDVAVERLQDEVMKDMTSILSNVDRTGVGVYVMASTLGSLEALLQFLKTSKIPVFAVNIGSVHKRDVKKAAVMREKGHPEYSCILAFDVKVDVEANKDAAVFGVKIFTADIIYHLFDSFEKYVAEVTEQKKKEKQNEAVFPCILSIYPNCIFNKKDPIVLGVKVEEGLCRMGTPLCIPDKNNFIVGRIGSIEHNRKPVTSAKQGDEVAIKIIGDSNIIYGRHFDHTSKLYSRINRDTINYLKEFHRDELKKPDWLLIMKLKKIFEIL